MGGLGEAGVGGWGEAALAVSEAGQDLISAR